MKNHHTIDVVALVLLVIGGLNWGFVGLLDVDIIGAVFGMYLGRIIFLAMGVSAIWKVIHWFQSKKTS